MCELLIKFYFVLLAINNVRSEITVRNGGRLTFDHPTETFGLSPDDNAHDFGLLEKALCTAAKSSADHFPISSSKRVQQRKLMEENNWSQTQLKSYYQSFRGIPFYGSSIVLSFDPLTGKYERRDNQNLKHVSKDDAEALLSLPKLSRHQCLNLCKAANKEEFLKDIFNDFEDYFYVDETDRGKLKLIVKVKYRVEGGIDTACLVDALLNGKKVIRTWQEKFGVAGTANGVGGNTKTGRYEFGPAGSGARFSQLRVDVQGSGSTCIMKNGEIQAFSGCQAQSPATFTCSQGSLDATSESYSPLNDCYFFADRYQDFVTDVLKVTPWYPGDRNYVKIIAKTPSDCNVDVEFCRPRDLAMYYPSSNTVVMSNGCDTYGNSFYHLCTCPDIVAHELGHAFTSKYSNLEYGSGGIPPPSSQLPFFTEASCVNEAFSDMIGVAFEYWLEKETDYLIGDECSKGSKPIRSMINATNSFTRGFSHLDELSMLLAESHDCAGIFNRAFYNLATTDGWDPVIAMKPFALANQCFWYQTITLREAACAVLNAATTLFSSTVTEQVSAAFRGVGIDNLCNPRPTATLTDCQVATVPLAEFDLGDFINFRYTIPSSFAGKPETYILVTATPTISSTVGVLWRSGSTAPSFPTNENNNLRGLGKNFYRYIISQTPTGLYSISVYVYGRTFSQDITLTACAKSATINEASLSYSNEEGDFSTCSPSISNVNWLVTSEPTLKVFRVTIPDQPSIHHTYRLSLQIVGYPADSSITTFAVIRLYVSKDTIVTDSQNAIFTRSLIRSTRYTVEAFNIGSTSVNESMAGVYYITLMGYISEGSVTEIDFSDITMTLCDVLDPPNFDPLLFDFETFFRLPYVISAASPQKLSTRLGCCCCCYHISILITLLYTLVATTIHQ